MGALHPLPDLTLELLGAQPAYRQIYQRLKDAILAGRLPPGARLPSARSLAAELHLARGTVEAAYQLLSGEGYAVGRGPAGTVVNPTLGPRPTGKPAPRPPALPTGPGMPGPEIEKVPPLFRMGLPALDAFPRKTWSRLVARCARSVSAPGLAYPNPSGRSALRHAIAAHLNVARGIVCTPEQVFVTAGYQGALGLVTHLLLTPGDEAWIEDPGYFFARDAFKLAGAKLVPVPVDEDGIDVETGLRRARHAHFAVVTPSHQFPTGAALSLSRRLALLKWAGTAGAWIIEDDYDGELRYRGRPLPALKSLDKAGRVIYAGTFSKVLFPGLRTGYLVVPDSLVERFTRAAALLHPAPSHLEQATIAAFMAEGHLARHIKRMRQLYQSRRDALAEALERTLGSMLETRPPVGGMHFLTRLPAGTDDRALATRAAARGLAPEPLSRSFAQRPTAPGLLLGFTNIPEEAAPAAARRLKDAIEA